MSFSAGVSTQSIENPHFMFVPSFVQSSKIFVWGFRGVSAQGPRIIMRARNQARPLHEHIFATESNSSLARWAPRPSGLY